MSEKREDLIQANQEIQRWDRIRHKVMEGVYVSADSEALESVVRMWEEIRNVFTDGFCIYHEEDENGRVRIVGIENWQ